MGKHCVRCDKTKSTCSFGKDKTRKDGLFTYCKVCAQEIKYERKGIFITKEDVGGLIVELKNCITCKEVKPISDYPESKIGLRNTLDECSLCREITLEARRLKNIERAKENHIKNREKNIAYSKEYYQANKDALLEKQKEYYERNKERILEINAQWKANNIERWREYHRNYEKEYYKEPENHRRRIAIYQRYRDKNRDKIRAYKTSERGREVNNRSWNKRRSIERQLLSTLTEEQWEECKRHFNFNCAYCESDESLTYDHFIPISKKGSYTVGNIIPACLSCNSSKSDSSFFDWYPLREFYCEEREEKILKYLKIENNKQQMAFF